MSSHDRLRNGMTLLDTGGLSVRVDTGRRLLIPPEIPLSTTQVSALVVSPMDGVGHPWYAVDVCGWQQWRDRARYKRHRARQVPSAARIPPRRRPRAHRAIGER